MSFRKTLETLNIELKEVFETYKNEEDIIPVLYQTNFISYLKQSYTDFLASATFIFDRYYDKIAKFEQKLDLNYKEYSKKNSTRKSQYLLEIAKNSTSTQESIAKIKEAHDKDINDCDLKINEYKNDIEINTASTEQKVIIVEVQQKEKIELFNYQVQNAKENYTKFISKSHNELDNKNEIIHTASSKRAFKFDESNKSVLDFLHKKVVEMDEMYAKKNKEFETEKLKISDAIINQSIRLNNKIKALNQAKNDELVAVKNKFDLKIDEINIQREHITLEYSLRNKNILKSFANKLIEIDNQNEVLTKNHNKKKDQLTRKFYFDNFTFDKEFNAIIDKYNNELEQCDKKASPARYKEIKKILRSKQQHAQKLKQELIKNQQKQLNELEYEYISESEKFKNDKYIAETEKNYDVVNITMAEKNAQERLNLLEEIAESDYNNEVLAINQKFIIRANELRANNEIRNKLFQKDQFKLEAKYRAILEGIIKDKTIYENDMKFQLEIEKLLHNKEDTIFEKEKSLNEVICLLEIEKNKLLWLFNNKKYHLNIEKTKLNTNYQINLLNTNTTYLNQLISHGINTLIQKKKETTGTCGFKILEKQNEETLNRSYLNKIYSTDINYIKNDLYIGRYRIERLMVICVHDTFYKVIENFSSFLVSFIDEINEYVHKTYLPILKLSNFIEEIINACTNFYCSLIDDYNYILQDLFEKRINFETGFKYKNQFVDLESKYKINESKIKSKEQSFIDTLNNYNQTITTFTTKIWTLENESSILAKELVKNNVSFFERKELIAKINKYKYQIKEFYKKNEISENLKLLMEKDLRDIPNQLKKNKENYAKEYSKIYNEQHKEALIYYQSIRIIDKTCSKHKNALISLTTIPFTQNITSYKKFFSKLQIFSNFLKNNPGAINKDYEKILHNVTKSIHKEQNYNLNFIKDSHNKNMKEYELHKQNLTLELNKARQDTLDAAKSAKNELKIDRFNIHKNHNITCNQMEINYKNELKNIKNKSRFAEETFKNDLFATSDNLLELENKEKNEIINYENSYKVNRINITNKYDNMKKQIENKYKALCQNLKNQLADLPYITKYESKVIDNTTKEENHILKQEINQSMVKHKKLVKNTNININNNKLILNKDIEANNYQKTIKCNEINKRYHYHVKNAYKNFLKESKR